MWLALIFQCILTAAPDSVVVADPAEVSLQGARQSFQLLLSGPDESGNIADLTRTATFRVSHPEVCEVSKAGIISGLKDGSCVVEAVVAGRTRTIT